MYAFNFFINNDVIIYISVPRSEIPKKNYVLVWSGQWSRLLILVLNFYLFPGFDLQTWRTQANNDSSK